MKLSSYRLGDLVIQQLNDDEKKAILDDFPDSFGAKYILKEQYNKKNNIYINDIDIITDIVLEHIDKISHLLPDDIKESTCIHLRLGDVIAGNEWHEKSKKPHDVNYYKNILNNDSKKKYVIGYCFFASSSSKNYEECIIKSNEYLQNILQEINATHFDSGNADIDLCCAIQADTFVMGRGFYSKLITDIRNKLNKKNIECISHI